MTEQMPHMLRADARDNRDRILDAARALFAERGTDVTMRAIARRAAVGPATLYRRFPTKQTLVDEVFADELRACRGIVEDGCADADPWRGFSSVIERLTVLNSRNQGFVDAFMSEHPELDTFAAHRATLFRMLAELARRAQQAGRLRRDFAVGDLVLMLHAGRALASLPPSGREAAARRFAVLAIDAFRESRASLVTAAPPTPRGPDVPSKAWT